MYIIAGIFILLNAVFIANEQFWFLLSPLLILIGTYYFVALDKILWFIIFTTPLSINLREEDFGVGISLPGEPLMVGVLIIVTIKMLYDSRIDKRILKHPITITILVNLAWIFFTSLTSSMPWVSFKFFLARTWFIVCFYYLCIFLFKKKENISKFIWAYIVPFTIVIFYTIIVHSQFGFTVETANWVMNPFYNDHTIYGAMLAMFLPVLVYFVFSKSYDLFKRSISSIFLLIFIVALVLSFTRAAWISLAVALVLGLIIYLRINLKLLSLMGLICLVFFFMFRNQILMKLEKNRQDSSSNLTEHVESISNISSDASNLERINRWESAIRMFKKHPVLGFGPGTYAFKYAPYQYSYEKTIISTNAGNRGNAHSEYIGPLAESGFFGMLSFVAIVIAAFYSGIMLYRKMENGPVKKLLLAMIIGLITYFIHGFLNNFLDTDKASVPVWGFIAAFVALEIYHLKNINPEEVKE